MPARWSPSSVAQTSVAFLCVATVCGGCNSGSREPSTATAAALTSGTTAPSSTQAGTVPTQPTQPTTTPSTQPTAGGRLGVNDPGVQTGLQLLRGDIDAVAASNAWAAEKVTAEQAQDLLGRLPLTPSKGPGLHKQVDTIVDEFGRTTDISLFVPSGPAPATGYPVVVFLHGLGGSSDNISGVAAATKDVIVVAPSAQQPPSSVRYEDEPPVSIPAFNQFPHWWVYRNQAFALKALDWVRERYPVDSNRVVLFGASMGGFGTWNVGLRFHDRFAKLISAAGGISRLEFAISDPTSRSLLQNVSMIPVWFAHGDQDQVVPVSLSRTIASDLQGLNLPFTYRELAGAGHDTAAFAQVFGEVETQLASALRDANPTRVTHRAIGNYHLGAYWVEMRGSGGTVDARVSGQTITVTTGGGATGATVYLDEDLVDVTKAVQVVVNGQTVVNQVPDASLAAVAMSFERTRDPLLTYRYMVIQR